MEHLNGDYELSLHASDYRAEKSISWDLGKISIWFKQGQDSGSNQGIKEEYRAGDVIEHYFPAPAPEKSLVVSFVLILFLIAPLDRSRTYHLQFPEILLFPIREQSKPLQTDFHRHPFPCNTSSIYSS